MIKKIFALTITCAYIQTGSGIALCLFAEHSLLLLEITVAVMGLGMASIYATGLLWSENYVEVTDKIGLAFTVSGMLGPQLFPIILGNYIEDNPMLLMNMVLAIVLCCTLVFILAALVGRSILTEEEVESDLNPTAC